MEKNNRFAGLGEDESMEVPAKASFKEKKATHDIFDILWKCIVCPEENKQRYRTALYRIWGAVVAAELNDVRGVVNPRLGLQHISTMDPLQQEKCRNFVRCLIKRYNGNLSYIAAEVTDWSHRFEVPTDKNKTKIAHKIQLKLDTDPYISSIRLETGMSFYKKETEIVPPAIAVPSTAAQAAPLLSRKAEDYYVDGVVAFIEGNTALMEENYRQAADRNHAQASWKMWEILNERAKTTPEVQREALHYLDVASHGCYWLAPLEIRRLYRQDPPVTTPHFDTLRNAATQENASSEAMVDFGLYCDDMLRSSGKAAYWYKQALAKNNDNINARVNLYALYSANPLEVCVSEEQKVEYGNYIREHAPPTSYVAHYSLPYQSKGYGTLSSFNNNLDAYTEHLRLLREAGDRKARFGHNIIQVSSIFSGNVPLSKQQTKEALKDFMQYLTFLNGSKGEGESEIINCMDRNNLSLATVMAHQVSSLSRFSLKEAKRTGYAEHSEYWKDFSYSLQDSDSYIVHELEANDLKLQAGRAVQQIMGLPKLTILNVSDNTMTGSGMLRLEIRQGAIPDAILRRLGKAEINVDHQGETVYIGPLLYREWVSARNQLCTPVTAMDGQQRITTSGLTTVLGAEPAK